MTIGLTPQEELDKVFERDIVPTLFSIADTPSDPTLVLLTSQLGASKSRATGRLRSEHGDALVALSGDELQVFHPRFRELSSSAAIDDARTLGQAAAAWMRGSMALARETRRSLLLDGTFNTPSVALGTAERFAAEGFQTRIVVVAVRRAESLMSVASRYLSDVQAGRPARFVDRPTHDQGLESMRSLVAAVEESGAVARLTILDRGGAPVFDVTGDGAEQPFRGASAALAAEQARPLNTLEAVQWLSELRHVTTFATSLRDRSRPLTELLIELHEVALREIIPELRVPNGSEVLDIQARASTARLAMLRQSLEPERRVDLAAPIVGTSGPDRGISR